MRRRLGSVRGRFLRDLSGSLRKYQRDRSEPNAQEVYSQLQKVLQEIENMLEERRITG